MLYYIPTKGASCIYEPEAFHYYSTVVQFKAYCVLLGFFSNTTAESFIAKRKNYSISEKPDDRLCFHKVQPKQD